MKNTKVFSYLMIFALVLSLVQPLTVHAAITNDLKIKYDQVNQEITFETEQEDVTILYAFSDVKTPTKVKEYLISNKAIVLDDIKDDESAFNTFVQMYIDSEYFEEGATYTVDTLKTAKGWDSKDNRKGSYYTKYCLPADLDDESIRNWNEAKPKNGKFTTRNIQFSSELTMLPNEVTGEGSEVEPGYTKVMYVHACLLDKDGNVSEVITQEIFDDYFKLYADISATVSEDKKSAHITITAYENIYNKGVIKTKKSTAGIKAESVTENVTNPVVNSPMTVNLNDVYVFDVIGTEETLTVSVDIADIIQGEIKLPEDEDDKDNPDTIEGDKVAPEIKVTKEKNNAYTVIVTDNVALGRAISPTGYTYAAQNEAKELSFSFSATENGNWTIVAYDKAGNKSEKTIKVDDMKDYDSSDEEKKDEEKDNKDGKDGDDVPGPEDGYDSYTDDDTLPQTGGFSYSVTLIVLLAILISAIVVYKKKEAVTNEN